MWTKLDDGFGDHPKLAALSSDAFRLHVRSMCYAGRYLTDGKVPTAFVASAPKSLVEELVSGGLWEVVSGGWMIHDYLDFNPTREKVLAERAAVAARKERHVERRVERRSERRSDGQENAVRNTAPVLVPSPSSSSVVQSPSETVREPSAANDSGQPSKPKKAKQPKPQQAQLVETEAVEVAADPDAPKPERKFTDAQKLWNVYREAFFVDCGSYPTAKQHYFVELDRLLKQHSLAVLVERLKVYFTSPAWIGQRGARDFGRFLKHIDSWALPEAETAEESVERMFVKGPQRMAQIANGHANPLLNGTNAT
jgi:hypothetical protein